jgi:putative ABC transport system permease protein
LPGDAGDTADDRERPTFFTQALQRLNERGDVVSAGAVGQLPLGGWVVDSSVRLPASHERLGGLVYALPRYWQTAGIRLLRGRLPSWDDVDAGSAVAVLSESAARRWFGERDPIGAALEDSDTGRRLTIVGVVGDVVAYRDLRPGPVAYAVPSAGDAGVRNLLVRARSHDDAVLRSIRREVVGLAPDRTVVDAAWWSDSISALTTYRTPRFQALVLGGFGLLALSLTALGIFAVIAFLVAIRTHEVGVRAALGATPGSLVGMMLMHAVVPVAAGLIAGLIATGGIARLAETQLFDVDARDPFALAAVLFAVLAIALVAAWIPARRASRVDPVVALRAQ